MHTLKRSQKSNAAVASWKQPSLTQRSALAPLVLLTLMTAGTGTSAADAPTLKAIRLNAQGSPYLMGQYDCAKEGVSKVVVEGAVELVHPDDTPGSPAPEIFLSCPKFEFKTGSKLRTRARLYVLGLEAIEGAVDIENTRGVNGADAPTDPAIYARSKAAKRDEGPQGQDAASAHDPFEGRAGSPAEPGKEGLPGTAGLDGRVGAKGANGRAGSSSASITLKAVTFGEGSTVHVTARGGSGGMGASGGTGEDGGDGGGGGSGGRGGTASRLYPAADGGRGGAGGDGGHGGPGGIGGDGGAGGAGGDAAVLLIVNDSARPGRPPNDWTYDLAGGKGGAPGPGGAPGRSGKGAPGGPGGCGGGRASFGPLALHGPGPCGGQGSQGRDGGAGLEGTFSPSGAWGRDGALGIAGTSQIGYVHEKKRN